MDNIYNSLWIVVFRNYFRCLLHLFSVYFSCDFTTNSKLLNWILPVSVFWTLRVEVTPASPHTCCSLCPWLYKNYVNFLHFWCPWNSHGTNLNLGETGFEPWSEWSECNEPCLIGIQTRKRTCRPDADNITCIGAMEGNKTCDAGPCPGRFLTV
jgi:hypothetical protein